MIASSVALGEGPWSLQQAAEAADVHPGTLIKRFGSRKGLLIALAERWVRSIDTQPRTRDPRRELRAWVLASLAPQDNPNSALGGLSMVYEDLREPELRVWLEKGWDAEEAYLSNLFKGFDLTGGPPPQTAARLLSDVARGALMRAAADGADAPVVDLRPSVLAMIAQWG